MINPEALLNTVIDNRYRLHKYIGKGSYGWAYEAVEELMGEYISRVAVKLFSPDSDEERSNVMAEIRGLAQLRNDYIIAYMAAGQIDEGLLKGTIYLVTELGESSLEKILEQQNLAEADLRKVVQNIAAALTYIHEKGAVHRDIKPANIFKVDNRFKLADFGLVKALHGCIVPAGDTGVRGTLAYMAPEVVTDNRITPAADVYALGVTILECLTGKHAHEGNTDGQFIANLISQPPLIPPSLSEPWKSIISGCLNQDDANRLSIDEVIANLERVPGSIASVTESPALAEGEENEEEIETQEVDPILAVKLKKTLIGHESAIKKIIYSPDGSRLASIADKIIKIWDTHSGDCLRTLDEHKDEVTSVVYSPDGSSLASAGHNTVKLWDAESGACLRSLSGQRGPVLSIVFTSDGRSLAGWSLHPEASWYKADSFIQIWDVKSGAYLRTLSGSNASVIRILEGKEYAYSPDRKKVAISIDKIIKIWDVETGACLWTLSGHNAGVRAIAYSSDGTRLASGSKDKTIKIWDAENGVCLKTLEEHKEGVASIACSPDGKSLASGSDDHTIRIWEVYEPDKQHRKAELEWSQPVRKDLLLA